MPLFTAQLPGIIAGPPFSFRLIWVATITTVIYYALAVADSTEVYKIRWCAGMTLLTSLQIDQLPSYTPSWFERHVISANRQLLHSIRGGSGVFLFYPGRFPWWKGEIGRIFAEGLTNMGCSAKVLMLPTTAIAGNGAMT